MIESHFQVMEDVARMFDQLLIQDEEISPATATGLKVVHSVVKLPGDASTRKYYRVSSENTSHILMKMEPFVDKGDQLNFIMVQKHLKSAQVDVPEIYDVDPARGLILLEDLGDVTLLRYLQEVSSSDIERHLYETVISSLVNLQCRASPEKAQANFKGMDAFKLRFDFEKLLWEMDNTVEHFYELLLKRKISETDRKIMKDGFSKICTYLANEPTVLAHRDFHSRNIMVTPAPKSDPTQDARLVMIDFQDARMGPRSYDLASLLKDSYYQLEEVQISRLIDYYIARFEALSGTPLNKADFRREFDLMSVQRNFKAIGSFASFLNRRGDASYVKYIGNTFENIRRTLLRYPEFSSLREVLFHYYYF